MAQYIIRISTLLFNCNQSDDWLLWTKYGYLGCWTNILRHGSMMYGVEGLYIILDIGHWNV